jgi:hypothetical protein
MLKIRKEVGDTGRGAVVEVRRKKRKGKVLLCGEGRWDHRLSVSAGKFSPQNQWGAGGAGRSLSLQLTIILTVAYSSGNCCTPMP